MRCSRRSHRSSEANWPCCSVELPTSKVCGRACIPALRDCGPAGVRSWNPVLHPDSHDRSDDQDLGLSEEKTLADQSDQALSQFVHDTFTVARYDRDLAHGDGTAYLPSFATRRLVVGRGCWER